MSEHEFDSYLALLSGMLGLSKSQREAISGELRDHMLERMHALVAAGVPRDEAIAKALEEFGDASRLASGLAAAAAIERRRQIMRWTVGTFTTLGLFVFVALILWPSGKNGTVVLNAQAQDTTKPDEASVFATKIVPKQVEDPNEVTFAKLQEKSHLEFIDTPLSDVIAYVNDDHEIQVRLDERALEEIGVQSDEPVTVDIRGVPLILALELILDQLELELTLREGVVIVTTADAADADMLVRCYSIGDLVDVYAYSPTTPSVGNSKVLADLLKFARARQRRMQSDSLVDLKQVEAMETAIIALADQLDSDRIDPIYSVISLIHDSVDPDSWEQEGPGTARMFGTTLVVKNSLRTHWKIDNFLTRLRRAEKHPSKSRSSVTCFPHASFREVGVSWELR